MLIHLKPSQLKFLIAEELHSLLEAEQDAKELAQINLRQLLKTTPKPPSSGDPEVDKEQAKKFAIDLQDKAKQGPVFANSVIKAINSLGVAPRRDRKRFFKWLALQTQSQDRYYIENIQNGIIRNLVDWIEQSGIGDEYLQMNIDDAFRRADRWHQEQFGKGTDQAATGKNVVYQFKDGFTIVKLGPEDCDSEGRAMGHCVGGYAGSVSAGSIQIYSLRDPQSKPHATIEIDYWKSVQQIKGKQNEPPIPKYAAYVKEWLKTTNFKYWQSEDYLSLSSNSEIIDHIMRSRSHQIEYEINPLIKYLVLNGYYWNIDWADLFLSIAKINKNAASLGATTFLLSLRDFKDFAEWTNELMTKDINFFKNMIFIQDNLWGSWEREPAFLTHLINYIKDPKIVDDILYRVINVIDNWEIIAAEDYKKYQDLYSASLEYGNSSNKLRDLFSEILDKIKVVETVK